MDIVVLKRELDSVDGKHGMSTHPSIRPTTYSPVLYLPSHHLPILSDGIRKGSWKSNSTLLFKLKPKSYYASLCYCVMQWVYLPPSATADTLHSLIYICVYILTNTTKGDLLFSYYIIYQNQNINGTIIEITMIAEHPIPIIILDPHSIIEFW